MSVFEVIPSAKEALMYGVQVEMSLEDREWSRARGQSNANRRARGPNGG